MRVRERSVGSRTGSAGARDQNDRLGARHSARRRRRTARRVAASGEQGLPSTRGSPPPDVKPFYSELLDALGTPSRLAEDGTLDDRNAQRTGGVWMEVRFDGRYPGAFRHSASSQPLHTDGSYIPSFPNATLMCCVSNVDDGGATTFVDARDVVVAVQTDEPRLFDALKETVIPHARSGDRRETCTISGEPGNWILNWNYFCIAADVSAATRRLADAFHEFLATSPTIACTDSAGEAPTGRRRGLEGCRSTPWAGLFRADAQLGAILLEVRNRRRSVRHRVIAPDSRRHLRDDAHAREEVVTQFVGRSALPLP